MKTLEDYKGVAIIYLIITIVSIIWISAPKINNGAQANNSYDKKVIALNN